MVNGRTGNCNGTVFQTQSMRCNQGYGTYAKSNVRMSAMFGLESGIGSVNESCTVLGTDRRSRAQYAVRQNITTGSDRPTDPAVRSAAKNRRSGPTDRPTWPRAARRKFGSDRPTDRPGRAQRGEKSTVGTDRPTDPAARSAAQNLRSGPTDRPTQNSLIRWVGRHRPTDPPGTPPGDVQRTIYFAPPECRSALFGD